MGAILCTPEAPTIVPAGVVKFDEFELDLNRYELVRAGRRLKLEKLPMELLILLVQKDGNLVTRQEIVDRLWGSDVFLDTEHGINTAIRKVRNVLRDDPERPRFVQTVTGKGYRFIAPINLIAHERGNGNHNRTELVPAETTQTYTDAQISSPLPQPHHRVAGVLRKAAMVLVGAIGIAAILVGLNARGVRQRLFARSGEPRIHSLAVLPLESLSADQNQDYFADGMTDELITMLAKYSDLRVISRTSVMQYKKAHRPLREIANELGVDGVLEGSVERSGGRVHINAQLVYAPEERHIWAESYDRPLNDLTNLQSDVAQTIARQVGIVATAVPRPVRRINPEAHDAYLWGRYYWFAFRDEEKIRKYFEKAIELQPDYAAAWSGLADTYLGSAVAGISRPMDVVPRGEAAARKALELDDSLPEAHNSMAAAYFCRWDLKNAEQESARALALNPSFAEGHHLRAYVLQGLNRMDEAVEEERKNVALDPFARPWALVVALLRTRQFDAALTEARLRSQAQPDNADLHLVLSYAYIYKGMDKEAAQEWETSLQLAGDKPSAAAMHQAFARGGMNAVYEWQLADLKKQAAAKYVSYENLAILSAKFSLKRETLHYLEKAYEEHEPKLVKIQSEPDFYFLHADPRYREIVRKMDLAPAW
jgi:TolB-like protein/DNA-binding winged helix-turn-helix (wHTH) protein/Flp pilus assembly protein TadD